MPARLPAVRTLARELVAESAALPRRTVPTLRVWRRSASERIRDWPARDVLALAEALIAAGIERFVAYELVERHRAAAAALGARELESLGRGMSSWDEVDAFAVLLAGPSWRAGQVEDAEIRRWSRSEDRWWRRAALVATVPLNMKSRGGTGDAPRTLALCDALAEDRDDMVVKALSWALRELLERDAASVRAFVAENEVRLAARVRREVRNKLESGLKSGGARRRRPA